MQSFLVACIFKYHRIRKSFYKQIDKYICLNDNQIKLLIDIGFDKNKIVKKYNFVPDAEADLMEMKHQNLPLRYVVFYGRIGEEKGIRVLQKIWEQLPHIPLVVMGGGPLEDEFSTWTNTQSHVHYLGYTKHDECLTIVKGSEFVVFPSIWYEGCSMVEIEAQSLGKAVVATDLGFSEEAISNGYNGYKVPLGAVDEFVKVIDKLWSQKELIDEMGRNARREYMEKYTMDMNYKQLMKIYVDTEENIV